MSEPNSRQSDPNRVGGRPRPEGEKYLLVSLGCAKNQVESEHLAGLLMDAGYRPTSQASDADLVVVNTCGFIRDAVEEAVDAILALAQEKREQARLVVVGCLVGRYGKKLARSLPEADLFIAPGEAARIVEHIANSGPSNLRISPPRGIFRADSPRAISTGPGWAYLRVSDGCAHRCHFCTIPSIRGRLRSRTMEDLVGEAARLAASGVRELNLVAQDLTSYGRDLGGGATLEELLARLDQVPGLNWIRPLYLHPDHLSRPLIKRISELEKVMPYFDLPLQHLADPVLKAMGRRRSGRELRELVDQVRQVCPEAVLRATLLVGHPGEGRAEFQELLEFVGQCRLDHLGCFAYSPEAGTRSAALKAPAHKTALERREKVMARQKAISARKLAERVGTVQEVLVLGEHPDSELVGLARAWFQAPEVDGTVILVDGTAQPGSLARCRITASHDYDLEGELV